jgi:hypothetical protein
MPIGVGADPHFPDLPRLHHCLILHPCPLQRTRIHLAQVRVISLYLHNFP